MDWIAANSLIVVARYEETSDLLRKAAITIRGLQEDQAMHKDTSRALRIMFLYHDLANVKLALLQRDLDRETQAHATTLKLYNDLALKTLRLK